MAHPARNHSDVRNCRLVQRGITHGVKLNSHAIRQASIAEAPAACAHYACIHASRIKQDEREAVGRLR